MGGGGGGCVVGETRWFELFAEVARGWRRMGRQAAGHRWADLWQESLAGRREAREGVISEVRRRDPGGGMRALYTVELRELGGPLGCSGSAYVSCAECGREGQGGEDLECSGRTEAVGGCCWYLCSIIVWSETVCFCAVTVTDSDSDSEAERARKRIGLVPLATNVSHAQPTSSPDGAALASAGRLPCLCPLSLPSSVRRPPRRPIPGTRASPPPPHIRQYLGTYRRSSDAITRVPAASPSSGRVRQRDLPTPRLLTQIINLSFPRPSLAYSPGARSIQLLYLVALLVVAHRSTLVPRSASNSGPGPCPCP